jgi:hypothetical protein
MKRTPKKLRYLSLLTSAILVITLFVCVGVSLKSNKVQSESRRFPTEDSPSLVKEIPQLIKTSKSAGIEFHKVDLFEASSSRVAGDATLRKAVSDGAVLNLNQENMRRVLTEDEPFLTLPLPDGNGGTLELELVRVNIFAPGFSVKTATSNGQPVDSNPGAHYRGIVRGNDNSLAAISVFDNEVMGFYSTREEGNNVLGRLGGDNPTNRHILYADKNLQASPEYGCDTEDTNEVLPASALQAPPQDQVAAKCVRIYLEADYDIYLNKGSVANVSNYLTGMFNQSAAIFANEGIPVSISEIFVWNTASPFTGTTTSQLLQQFRSTRTSFNGDLAHFLAIRNLGGIAYLDVMCNRTFAYGVSSIHASFQNVPTYSWTVDVFTHETGHNIASPHTHACQWNGNGTAIDGCYTTEGGCPNPGIPPAGGTIMSYCHLQSIGKNFTLGFGPQPRALMVNRFASSAPCLQDCASSTNRPDFDFDGDGKSDISVFRASDGGWHLLRSSAGYTGSSFGVSTDMLAPADYDGDGKADLAVFRASTGNWYIQRSTLGFTGAQFGQNGDIPMPGDFDGDDKADLSVFRPADGGWYRINSSNGQFVAVSFGQNGDVPLMGDFDGDGKADQAVFRPSTSSWYMQRSTAGFTGVQFGAAGDVAVPADYDGDGKTDIAVFRPSTGAWYLLRSQLGLASYAFGVSTDRPAPADYDGDAKADIAVFRQSVATWYLQQTTAGFSAQQFGVSTDKAVPAAFLP